LGGCNRRRVRAHRPCQRVHGCPDGVGACAPHGRVWAGVSLARADGEWVHRAAAVFVMRRGPQDVDGRAVLTAVRVGSDRHEHCGWSGCEEPLLPSLDVSKGSGQRSH